MNSKVSSLYPVQELRRRAAFWALKLRVNPKLIRIQKLKTKWGSCSAAGVITLAEDLIDQTSGFQDVVIVHELLHLRYPTHGKLFKTSMSAYVPNWRSIEIDDHCS